MDRVRDGQGQLSLYLRHRKPPICELVITVCSAMRVVEAEALLMLNSDLSRCC